MGYEKFIRDEACCVRSYLDVVGCHDLTEGLMKKMVKSSVFNDNMDVIHQNMCNFLYVEFNLKERPIFTGFNTRLNLSDRFTLAKYKDGKKTHFVRVDPCNGQILYSYPAESLTVANGVLCGYYHFS